MLRRALAQNVRAFCQAEHIVRPHRLYYSTEARKKQGQEQNCGPKKGDRVIVAMSGGVDSSVTARLLADKDYDLSAVFMRNWDTRDETGSDVGCEWEKDWEDVQLVCRQLGIPCELIDLSREYWINVFEPSLAMWEAGQTPNPDVWCNREVKFGALMDRVVGMGGAWLATGHYAGVEWGTIRPPFHTASSRKRLKKGQLRPRLVRSDDRTKDQTYYLSGIKESSLAKTIFPLQHIPKTEVRELAARFNLPTAQRKESTGICFIGEKKRHFQSFLEGYIPSKPGPIIDWATRKNLGTHHGLWRYTIGQSAKVPGQSLAMHVAAKNTSTNELVVVPGSTHPRLYSAGMVVKKFRWIWQDEVPSALHWTRGFKARVQFRHRMLDVPCTVRSCDSGMIEIAFKEPQLAIAAGQVAALYNIGGKWCLGSGEIVKSLKSLPPLAASNKLQA